jgi:hypothetical protein
MARSLVHNKKSLWENCHVSEKSEAFACARRC